MIHNPSHTNILLEHNQPLSQSLLWKLQRNFFHQQGIQAWNTGTVPHYVTSNPFIANAYAKVVFGFLRDWHNTLDLNQPVYILELGAGSGRFAYHFLKKFFGFFPHSTLKHIRVTYILSDFTQQNLNYWHSHPFLQPFIQQGILEIARFDAQQDQSIELNYSREILSLATLKNPLIVLANYFFDCLPQDIFTLSNNQLYATLINLSSYSQPNYKDPNLIKHLHVTYEDQPITHNYYQDPNFNQILSYYQEHLTNTTILFPKIALHCIRNLRNLSRGRMLFLSGDKGYSQESDLHNRSKPNMTFHGNCFSMMVNYHAIGQYFINQGGHALHTTYHHSSLNISAFLFGGPPTNYIETRQAYREYIEKLSPDDFFSVKKAIEKNYESLTLQQIIAYLRFSGWDANIFFGCYSVLMSRVESASDLLKQQLYSVITNIWDTYYPIGEEQNLPFHLGMLLMKMKYYAEAANYLQQSIQIYGLDANIIYNIGTCYQYLEYQNAAHYCMTKAIALNPALEAT
ncbi:tetratricopeptide repeat protein [Umezakia ovalisporum]|jgi:hypothetical protein|uniref:tetratricopeptide repeat protein n=1 Tax=Umezakia ovalisporum TaxID=75695 RepID=UPI0024742C5D|nr:SAM-dependent methyltransferase [Umezakia ovalisporum]MBI1240811.1 hypothetical protein [Nostoc sp. RI_552]MDH6083613.1 SAM-dependent methyltransferase [Umezakia ovalisporum TAC611]